MRYSLNTHKCLLDAEMIGFAQSPLFGISFKVLLYADSFFFSVNFLKNILIIFLCVGNNHLIINS